MFRVFLLEMQAKREVLLNLNDNKTSRTPVHLLWPLHVALNVFNIPFRWFALKKVYFRSEMSLSNHFMRKTWVNFGWIDGHWSLSRSQILEFENFPEMNPEPDLTFLDQDSERRIDRNLKICLRKL